MITVTNEIQVEYVLECFNGVHFDVNDDFSMPDNIENAMLISTKNGERVECTMFIYPNGAVEANYNNVAYSAADGSVDYELLYEIVKEIENS